MLSLLRFPMSQQGLIKEPFYSEKTIDGKREILIKGGLAFMEQKAPRYQDVAKQNEQIMLSLGLTKDDILTI